ncbi:MAG: peptidylprolyl isomerase [Acidobacteria bacterium]|nr:MAG: peptidylprolyl isomerase [Acidobacteriota bacterium]
MRKLLTLLIVFSSLHLVSQTSKPAAKAMPKKPAASAAAGPPTAIIDTTAGKLTCVLYPDKAPIGVANFIGLARGTKDWTNPATGRKMHGVPLYNGTIFHRVIPEFMIQGGDPLGTGTGDPGYKFKNETSPDLLFDRPGRLAYANAGPDTNGSQFFVTEVPYPHLNGGYTIFGQCDDASVELVKKITHMPRDGNDRPNDPPKIVKIAILHAGGARAPVHHPTHKPAPKPAAPKTSNPQ